MSKYSFSEPTFLLIYDSRDRRDGLQIFNWRKVFELFLGKLIWKVDYVRISSIMQDFRPLEVYWTTLHYKELFILKIYNLNVIFISFMIISGREGLQKNYFIIFIWALTLQVSGVDRI